MNLSKSEVTLSEKKYATQYSKLVHPERLLRYCFFNVFIALNRMYID